MIEYAVLSAQRPTQREKLINLFKSRVNEWIPLPDILALGIAQYNARILELRREGMPIENKTEDINGIRHSWFMYRTIIIDGSGQGSFFVNNESVLTGRHHGQSAG